MSIPSRLSAFALALALSACTGPDADYQPRNLSESGITGAFRIGKLVEVQTGSRLTATEPGVTGFMAMTTDSFFIAKLTVHIPPDPVQLEWSGQVRKLISTGTGRGWMQVDLEVAKPATPGRFEYRWTGDTLVLSQADYAWPNENEVAKDTLLLKWLRD